jgi:WD40 repeat protein
MSNPINAQESSAEPAAWVQHVEPGVRLVGKASFSSLELSPGSITAWSPDGEYLLGAAGRRLVEIDWDQQKVARQMALPMNPISDVLKSLLYSPDGENVLVHIHDQARSPVNPDNYWIEVEALSIDEEPTTAGQRLLVYDRNGNLTHQWDLSNRIMDLDDNANCRVALSDNRTVLIHSDTTIVALDYRSGQVQAMNTGNYWAFPLSASELLLAQSREVWDLRQKSTYSVDEIGLPQKFEIRAVDPAGVSVALFDPLGRRLIAWNRQTREMQTLLSDVEHVGCLFSSNGQLCFINVAELYGAQNFRYRSKIAVYDLRKKELVGQTEFTDGPKDFSIRPGQESLIVESPNDSTFVEVSVDDDFTVAVSRALNRLPIRGRLSFVDNDQVLVLHGNNSFLQNNEAAQVTQHVSYNPDNCVYSPTKPQRFRCDRQVWNDHVVETGHWSEDKFKRLYTIKPSTALSTLKSLLGVQGDSAASIQSVHLSFDRQGELIRDLYIENQEIVRLRLSQASSGRQVSEVRVDVPFDKSASTLGSVSPNGQRIAIVNDRQLTVLDAKLGQPLGEWTVGPHTAMVLLDERGQYVLVAAGKPDRNWVYQTHFDQLHVYSVASGEVVWSETNREIKGFGFQPGSDRLYVLASGKENTLRIFDRDTWQETWRHATSYAPAYGMAMSSTGHEIAIGLRDSRVEFWKLSEIQTR